jgi:hypothetical protein
VTISNVIPAKLGRKRELESRNLEDFWIPAFAGMTMDRGLNSSK